MLISEFVYCGGIGRQVKEQTCTKQKGVTTSQELRLVQKYMQEARPLEVGIDEVALRKLVKSSTFKKFVHRVELENEVVELHQQLEREVGLHNSLQSALSHPSSTELPESVVHDLPSNVSLSTITGPLGTLPDIGEKEASVRRWKLTISTLSECRCRGCLPTSQCWRSRC